MITHHLDGAHTFGATEPVTGIWQEVTCDTCLHYRALEGAQPPKSSVREWRLGAHWDSELHGSITGGYTSIQSEVIAENSEGSEFSWHVRYIDSEDPIRADRPEFAYHWSAGRADTMLEAQKACENVVEALVAKLGGKS